MISWKIYQRSKKTIQLSTYILNSWEITKIILVKQNSSSNKTKTNNNK